MGFNDYLLMMYGISGDDLTDDDYEALYSEYINYMKE